MNDATAVQHSSTPLLSLLFNITAMPALKAQFMLNEERFFDAFSIGSDIRELFRRGADTCLLANKLTEELAQFSVPGKVLPYNPDTTSISVLAMIFNLAIGTIKKDQDSVGTALSAFNVAGESDIANIHKVMDASIGIAERELALKAVCDTIYSELHKLISPK